MTLLEKQFQFVRDIVLLISFMHALDYEVTFGDAARIDGKGHKKNSKHYQRLAIDLNLFKDGKYLIETKDHRPFGEYWTSIGHTWGGDWNDGNHYEW